MSTGKLKIPARKVCKSEDGVVRLPEEAYKALVDVVNESTQNIKQVASAMILYVVENDLIEYERGE